MPVWTPHEEGESLTAPKIDDAFTTLETSINSIAGAAIAPKSLNHQHLPSLVKAVATISIQSDSVQYDNYYPGWTDDTMNTSNWGWETVANLTSNLIASFPTVNLATDNISGLLILANIDIEDIVPHYTDKAYDATAYFKIQIYADGSWQSLIVTERLLTGENEYELKNENKVRTRRDVPIRALVKPGESYTEITLVRVLVSFHDTTVSAPSNTGYVTLGRATLSVLALHGA